MAPESIENTTEEENPTQDTDTTAPDVAAPPPRPLTSKQQAFIDCYNGNGTKAAIQAGYAVKSANRTAVKLLLNTVILSAIQAREAAESKLRILTGQELRRLWSFICSDELADPKDRLKASELLGRSKAMFTDKVLSGTLEQELANMTDEEIDDELARLDAEEQAQPPSRPATLASLPVADPATAEEQEGPIQ